MSEPIRNERELLREAMGPTPECPPLEALVASPQDAVLQRHVEECPHCRAELALLHQFETAEAQLAEAADLAWIESELLRRSPVAAPQRESLADQARAWFDFLLSPAGRGRLSLVSATLLVLVAAGIYLGQGGGVRPSPNGETSVWRSGQVTALSPVGDLGEAPKQLRWEEVPGATSYHVRLLEVDGTEIWSADSAVTSVDFPNDLLPKLTAGRAFQWDVIARDAAGRQLATSSLQIFHILATPK